ncbi:MAG: DUF58 domain-containing protein [Rhodoferax sp.]|jgi:uncharacterized protein (DUF58 family)|nr:DUF58 domain-containing protein [Rhodoferax sp.]
MAPTQPLPRFPWHPGRLVRARFRRWLQARLTPRDVMLLTQRNVYILPTRPGLMLAATLLVLLVASINYQLNLGYLLTFLLAGSALVGMHLCHGTLRGLSLQLLPVEPGFQGATTMLSVDLVSTRKRVRHGIGMRLLDGDHWVWSDVPSQGRATVHVAFTPQQRGLVAIPALTAETRFPLGTFRVWTVWRPASRVLVYPAPEQRPPPLPDGQPLAGDAAHVQARPASGDFDGVRAYQRGDPLKLVVWKKWAKADELVSRDTQQSQRHQLWLDLAQTGLPLEPALSRLCAWVLLADRQGLDFGLRLGPQEIRPGSGPAHRRRCLEALARYGVTAE